MSARFGSRHASLPIVTSTASGRAGCGRGFREAVGASAQDNEAAVSGHRWRSSRRVLHAVVGVSRGTVMPVRCAIAGLAGLSSTSWGLGAEPLPDGNTLRALPSTARSSTRSLAHPPFPVPAECRCARTFLESMLKVHSPIPIAAASPGHIRSRGEHRLGAGARPRRL